MDVASNMEQLTDLKAILHSKRANIYYLEMCRVMQKDGRVLYLTEAKKDLQYWNVHCRAGGKRYGSKQSLWETLRVTIRFFIFSSWEAMLKFLLMTNDEKDEFMKKYRLDNTVKRTERCG
jgi:hypothetical protein